MLEAEQSDLIGPINAFRKDFRMHRLLSALLLTILLCCTACAPTTTTTVPKIPTPTNPPVPPKPGDLDPIIGNLNSPADDFALSLASYSSGVYMSGVTYATDSVNGDAFISKYRSTGELEWISRFGSSGKDIAAGVASDLNDNVYVYGYTNGKLKEPLHQTGDADFFLRKYSPNGITLWTKQFGETDYALAGNVIVSRNGNIYTVGTISGPPPAIMATDVVVNKFDTQGNPLPGFAFGTAKADTGEDITFDRDGNIYIAGLTKGAFVGRDPDGDGSDMYLRKNTSSNTYVWTQPYHFGYSDIGKAVAATADTVCLVGEFVKSSPISTSDKDLFLQCLFASKDPFWGISYEHDGDDTVEDVAIDSGGVMFVGAQGYPPNDPKYGSKVAFIQKVTRVGTSPNGINTVWFEQLDSSGLGSINGITTRSGGEVYIAGSTRGVLGKSNHGGSDAFIRRINSNDGSTVWTAQ